MSSRPGQYAFLMLVLAAVWLECTVRHVGMFGAGREE